MLLVAGLLCVGCLSLRFCWVCAVGKKKPKPQSKSPSPPKPADFEAVAGDFNRADGDYDDESVRMQCVVPEAMLAGQQLTWLSPSGKLVAMTIPEGSEPGSILEFRVPTVVMHERPGGAMAASPASAATASPRGETQGATPGTTQGGTPGATCPPEWGR